MATVFWMSRLKDGVSAADYERWVKDFDYVMAAGLPSLRTYKIYRIQGAFPEAGSAPFDYLEVVEVADLEAYRRDLAEHPAGKEIAREWDKYVELVYGLSGEMIPPGLSR